MNTITVKVLATVTAEMQFHNFEYRKMELGTTIEKLVVIDLDLIMEKHLRDSPLSFIEIVSAKVSKGIKIK